MKATVPVRVYRGDRGLALSDALRDLWAGRELLAAWTVREVRVRYKQSVLGAAWAILQPLSMMVVFSIIFTRFISVPTGEISYPLFSYVALLPWTFFSGAITSGTVSVVNQMALVSKIQFPREILPLAQIGAAGFDFCVASAVFVAMAFLYRVSPGWTLLAVPGLLLIQILFTAGLVLMLSALTVRCRDTRFVVPLAMQLWMYATPVIYPLDLVPTRWQWLYRLNPMAVLIEGYRDAVINLRMPASADVALAALVSLGVLIAGYVYFKRTEMSFADVL